MTNQVLDYFIDQRLPPFVMPISGYNRLFFHKLYFYRCITCAKEIIQHGVIAPHICMGIMDSANKLQRCKYISLPIGYLHELRNKFAEYVFPVFADQVSVGKEILNHVPIPI